MRLHDARHWYATQLVAAGTDLNTVADKLGHSSPAFTLAVYGHSDSTRAPPVAQPTPSGPSCGADSPLMGKHWESLPVTTHRRGTGNLF
jgi:hypothetical protein